MALSQIHEQDIDEATEEAVLNSLITATSVVGREGNTRPALKDMVRDYQIKL
ncbi:hypothetical protein [Paraliobacillus salinarum]|uniref:hypothetical protein n=1 Tax=Paraliobacillus salinarum TaxID=1158996 RepID=UPI001FE24E1B|nr:hypothetical protein [Paraliobacillus salinarum]